jgi:predicted Na+-dependent transporter
MSALSRVCPDEFTIAMLATVMLGFLLPCRGTSAEIFGGLAAVAIGLLFFLQGARLSRAAIIAGALHGGCTWSFLPPPLCCFQSSDSLCGRYPRSC